MGTEKQKRLAPIHPGEVLHDQRSASPRTRIGGIVKGERGMVDIALRFARYFGPSPDVGKPPGEVPTCRSRDALSTQIEREVLRLRPPSNRPFLFEC